MKVHCCRTERIVMLWILLQCLSEVKALDFVHASSPRPRAGRADDDDEQAVELNDSLKLGIKNIVTIMESINSETNDHLLNKVHDDQTVNHSTSHTLLRPLNDPEYQKFGCGLHCGLRPAQSAIELKRIRNVLPDKAHSLTVVTDCAPLNESNFDTTYIPIRTECISHYTGNLIHIIVTYDKFSQSNDSTKEPMILGDGFGEQIQHVFQKYVSKDRGLVTSLYVTLDLPLRSLDAADLTPFSASLKHLAITSHSLQTIDQLLLNDLHLDYFILDKCHRVQERVSRPQETRISPLPDWAHRVNCVVIWSYSCSTSAGDFELLADKKTQNRLCHPDQLHNNRKLVDASLNTIQSGQTFKRRNRRSPLSSRIIEPTEFPPRFHPSIEPFPFFVEKLIQRFEDDLAHIGNDVRRDISWYQTVMYFLIGILAIIVLILGAILVAFWIFLRQVLRGKIKSLRATM